MYLIMLLLLMVIKFRIKQLIFFDMKENKLVNVVSETIQYMSYFPSRPRLGWHLCLFL